MDIQKIITSELKIRPEQTQAVIELIDDGNTIPFIARYRKEVTGGLNDEVLRAFDQRLQYLRNLEDRKAVVRASIEEQGKMTEELSRELERAETAVQVEDLYRPYKPKRRTRAMIAREKGVLPLAEYFLSKENTGAEDPMEEAAKYISKEKDVETAEQAVQYAEDIIAGDFSDDPEVRKWMRENAEAHGTVVSEAKDKEAESPYENYYEYQEPVKKIPSHRVLAINRGEKEKFLKVQVEVPEDGVERFEEKRMEEIGRPATRPYVREALQDGYKRLIQPSVETEIRGELTEKAEDGAIEVFGKNLRQLLMQPPIAGKTVLGWDPAFRTGCKLAVVDPTGKVLDTKVIFPTAPQNRVEEAKRELLKMVKRWHVDVISLGNGTASRESEQIIADFIRESGLPLEYAIVNEAGASVSSASERAAEEFPQFDVGQRSAASMARRLQDPLAELVKIDPRSIGVGQYQHDMNQKKLGNALSAVVEDCVNQVGVDVNTASAALLEYVSGISKTVAKNIVAYREENGPFTSRRQLLKVSKLGPKAFQQSAGFLRIRGGEEVLDMTAVHPESYKPAKELLRQLGFTEDDVRSGKTRPLRASGLKEAGVTEQSLAEDLGIGIYTLRDILSELEKPGRDPRDEVQKPILRSDVLSMEDLTPGMKLKGTVRNIVDFGAFVDIGVHEDGLVHISEMADHYISHPLEVVKVGDIVTVWVLSVDLKKQRIALTMKNPDHKTASSSTKNSPARNNASRAGRQQGTERANSAGRRNGNNNGDSSRNRGNNRGSRNRRDGNSGRSGNHSGKNRKPEKLAGLDDLLKKYQKHYH